MDKQKDWLAHIPDQSGFDWFTTREEAEAYTVEAMTEILHDQGEALDGQAIVAVVVSRAVELVDDDPSEDVAEELRRRGLDYFISGYRPRESTFMADMARERADAVSSATAFLHAEIERLRAEIERIRALADTWSEEADCRRARASNPEVVGMIERMTEEAAERAFRRCANDVLGLG